MDTPSPATPCFLPELYILYGFAFLVIAVVVFLQPRHPGASPLAANIRLLAWFGLLHGLREWWVGWSLLHGAMSWAADWAGGALLLVSFVFLFEFGRRLLFPGGSGAPPDRIRWSGPWIYLPLALGLIGWVWFVASSAGGMVAGARFGFGFTGALAAGWALSNHSRDGAWAVTPLAGRNLRIAGAALAVYGLAAGLVVEADPALPGWIPTSADFYREFRIPIEVLRLGAAAFLAGALVRVTGEVNAEAQRREDEARAELARLNVHLARRVREDTVSLEAAIRELRSEIEERRKVEGELRDSELRQREASQLAQRERGRMRALLSAMGLGILFEDREHRIEYVNPAFLRMWAIGEDFDPVGSSMAAIVAHSGRRLSASPEPAEALLPILCPHEISERRDLEFDDGRIFAQSSYPVTDVDGHTIGRMWLYEDITHERQTALQLIYLAERDPLTGLYNRYRFREQLESGIAASIRNGGRLSLVYFDLDGFKTVNDTFGHKAGDTVLVRVAGEIGTLVRTNEMFARLGGDEFAILAHLAPGDDANALPIRIIHAIAAIPFRFRGANTRVTGSVGVALFPEHGENAEDLSAHADAAMYRAKAQGRNTWAMYEPAGESAAPKAPPLAWDRRIAEVLERDLLELHFQGIHDLVAGTLNHLEVLVRMRDLANPGALISPGRFLPAAEKSGQIREIDRRVLARTVELLGRNPSIPPLAVNLSGRTFEDPFVPQFIRALLAEHQVGPGRLIIELAESAAVADIQDAQRFIEAMRRAGCRVCLEDFGSGFASFSYLRYLGAEMLKIGGRYTANLPANPEHQVLVKAMVDVARGLGKTLVAACVEDAETLALIRKLGVHLAQGYCLDRPAADHPALGRH